MRSSTGESAARGTAFSIKVDISLCANCGAVIHVIVGLFICNSVAAFIGSQKYGDHFRVNYPCSHSTLH
jgi:hypothetical protein